MFVLKHFLYPCIVRLVLFYTAVFFQIGKHCNNTYLIWEVNLNQMIGTKKGSSFDACRLSEFWNISGIFIASIINNDVLFICYSNLKKILFDYNIIRSIYLRKFRPIIPIVCCSNGSLISTLPSNVTLKLSLLEGTCFLVRLILQIYYPLGP